MKTFFIDEHCPTTQDCKNLLNKVLKSNSKWKRVTKRKMDAWTELRVFVNEFGETYTMSCSDDTKILEMDLRLFDHLIDEINRIAKFYFTCDYGDIHFNPSKMALSISGGDGGYFYSTKSHNYLRKKFQEDFDIEALEKSEPFIEFNKHPTLSEIKSVEWEAEWSPDDDPEFILIGKIIDLA